MNEIPSKCSFLYFKTELADPDITHWLSRARDGDVFGFEKLFEFYICRLRSFLRQRLTDQDRAEGFEDDLAIESMAAIWEDLTAGRFGHVKNREEFWFAMMRVAMSRAMDRRRYLRRKKRLFKVMEAIEKYFNFCVEPNAHEDAFDFLEVWEGFTKSLPDDQYREIIRLKMDGLDAEAIAEMLDVVPRTIFRKQAIMKNRWELLAASNGF